MGVKVKLGVALTSVPLASVQLTNEYPAAGTAASVMLLPVVTVAAPSAVPPPTGHSEAVMVYAV